MVRCLCPCHRRVWMKYLVFTVNFFIWILGLAAVILGIWANIDNRVPSVLLGYLPVIPALLLLIVGAICCFIGFVGWLGVLRENFCLIRMFCVLSSALFVTEIVAGVLMFLLMDRVKTIITYYLLAAIVAYQDDEIVQEFIDFIQQKLECCGETGYHDWEQNAIFSCSSSSSLLRCGVPPSCCIHFTGTHCGLQARLSQGGAFANLIHVTGCSELIFQIFKNRLFHISFFAFAVGICEVLCVVMAVMLLHDISVVEQHPSGQELSLQMEESVPQPVRFFPAASGD